MIFKPGSIEVRLLFWKVHLSHSVDNGDVMRGGYVVKQMMELYTGVAWR